MCDIPCLPGLGVNGQTFCPQLYDSLLERLHGTRSVHNCSSYTTKQINWWNLPILISVILIWNLCVKKIKS